MGVHYTILLFCTFKVFYNKKKYFKSLSQFLPLITVIVSRACSWKAGVGRGWAKGVELFQERTTSCSSLGVVGDVPIMWIPVTLRQVQPPRGLGVTMEGIRWLALLRSQSLPCLPAFLLLTRSRPPPPRQPAQVLPASSHHPTEKETMIFRFHSLFSSPYVFLFSLFTSSVET